MNTGWAESRSWVKSGYKLQFLPCIHGHLIANPSISQPLTKMSDLVRSFSDFHFSKKWFSPLPKGFFFAKAFLKMMLASSHNMFFPKICLQFVIQRLLLMTIFAEKFLTFITQKSCLCHGGIWIFKACGGKPIAKEPHPFSTEQLCRVPCMPLRFSRRMHTFYGTHVHAEIKVPLCRLLDNVTTGLYSMHDVGWWKYVAAVPYSVKNAKCAHPAVLLGQVQK